MELIVKWQGKKWLCSETRFYGSRNSEDSRLKVYQTRKQNKTR